MSTAEIVFTVDSLEFREKLRNRLAQILTERAKAHARKERRELVTKQDFSAIASGAIELLLKELPGVGGAREPR